MVKAETGSEGIRYLGFEISKGEGSPRPSPPGRGRWRAARKGASETLRSGPEGVTVEADGDDLRVDAETGCDSLGEVITDLSAGHEIGKQAFHLGGVFIEGGAKAGFRYQEAASEFVGFLFDGVFPAAVVLGPAGEIRE